MASKRMSEADQVAMLMTLQKKLAEMKRMMYEENEKTSLTLGERR